MASINTKDQVAVCSRSFSKNITLRRELLAQYKNVTFNDEGLKLQGDSLVSFLKGHQKAITALEKIDDYVLSQLPELNVISKYGVGIDMIDINAIGKYGKKFGWTGGVNKRSVSELVISFAIALLRHVPVSHKEVISGTWRQHIGGQLSGRTIGIIGCGHIGKDLIKLLQPFECSILVNDIRKYEDFYREYNLDNLEIEELLKRSDIVTLHVPLDESTKYMLTGDKLALMKKSAILINLARGGLVDEIALKNMLSNKLLAAAGFDVFLEEPPQDQELLNLPNFLVTPHIGGSSEEAILEMGRAAIQGLETL
ncbi:phosphoglycerate dehydrogenase [Candidatus Pseudothioglobus singularis]|nr:phosphoglycerate dehydrogenase [Candidatus Pseudothioglobus singularis]MDB4847798.1 phosphoglycerate dehydrogenase [Candidatus Pseudothioglobus singularis]